MGGVVNKINQLTNTPGNRCNQVLSSLRKSLQQELEENYKQNRFKQTKHNLSKKIICRCDNAFNTTIHQIQLDGMYSKCSSKLVITVLIKFPRKYKKVQIWLLT